MPDYTTSIELHPRQSLADMLMQPWCAITGDYGILSPWSRATKLQAPTEASWTRWPAIEAPGREAFSQMRLAMATLVIRASSSMYPCGIYEVGELETRGVPDVGAGSAESSVSTPVWIETAKTERARAEGLVVGAFAEFEEVTAVYVQVYREELQFTFLLGIATYDDNLMDRLLDREYDIQHTLRGLVLSFSYIPKVYENRRDIVHPGARLIYEK